MVVNAVMGGKTEGGHKPGGEVKDLAAGHANVEDAVASIMRAMTF